MFNFCVTIFLICFAITNAYNNDISAPVLIWGDSLPSSAPALKTFSASEFDTFLHRKIKDDTFTIVFADKSLKHEDLSGCKVRDGETDNLVSCFNGLQKISGKTYLPNVESAYSVLKTLHVEEDTKDVKIHSDDDLNELLNVQPGKIVFVSIDSKADKSTSLSTYDKLMEKLTNELIGKNRNVIIIFTGINDTPSEHQSHRVVREAAKNESSTTDGKTAAAAAVPAPAPAPVHTNPTDNHKQVDVKQEPESQPGFFLRDRFIMYYKTLAIYTETNAGDNTYTRTEITMNDANWTLGAVDDIPTLFVELTSTLHQNTLSLEITQFPTYWAVTKLQWSGNELKIKSFIGANHKFSYACHPSTIFHILANERPFFEWTGLQLEPNFDETVNTPETGFNHAWDCVGFTSPGLWGGLFVTIMLLFILSIGISWIMEVRTMDRFDDPKGKTITVTVTE